MSLYRVLVEQVDSSLIVVTAEPRSNGKWLVIFGFCKNARDLLDQTVSEAIWLPRGEWDDTHWPPSHIPLDVLTKAQDWLRRWPVPKFLLTSF
jgi:hypothetical protein